MKTDTLAGIGPKSAQLLIEAGISSEDALRRADPYELYAHLKADNKNVSLNFLYAIIGAQEKLNWQVIARERRTEILLRLDEMGLAPK